jgi:hypothetical protein
VSAPRVRVRHAQLFERPVTLRLPFRFGAATVTRCPQAFVQVELEVDGLPSHGVSAELMVPKWFDKSPALTHEQNFEQLRTALRLALEAYASAGVMDSAYALSQRAGETGLARATALGLPRLAAQFGPAQFDKAVADAVLRAQGLGWCQGLRAGALGDPWSTRLPINAAQDVALRHTVGLADRLRDDEPGPDPADGLPTTLQSAIAAYGLTHFKLKLCGVPERDLDRLGAIAALLDAQAGDYRVTLDGNESFADPATLAQFWQQLRANAPLQGLVRRTLLLEQPLPRSLTLSTPIQGLGIAVPVIIDESDDHDGAFETSLSLGYRGISSKACKGIYRSLRSAAHIAAHPGSGWLLSGEDLTCQAGLAVQQDTLLAASLGVTHIERNGHHYVDGFGIAPAAEAAAFAAAHPGLYAATGGPPRLAVRNGRLDLHSLHGPGFARAAEPDWSSLTPIS